MDTQKWEYTPKAEMFLEGAITAAGTLATLGILSAVFNPMALGALMLFPLGVARAVSARPDTEIAEITKNRITPHITFGADDEVIKDQLVIHKLAHKFGLGYVPKLAPVPPDYIEKHIPWRKKIRLYPRYEEKISRLMNFYFGTFPGAIMTTDKALKSFSAQDRAIIYAHEMAHSKARDHAGLSVEQTIMRGAGMKGLLYITVATQALVLIADVLAVPGISAVFNSIAAGVSGKSTVLQIAGAFGAATAAHWISANLSSRIREFRADRNALFIAQNIDQAKQAFTNLYAAAHKKSVNELGKLKPDTLWYKLWNTHPGYNDRIRGLDRSWQKIQAFNSGLGTRKGGLAIATP